MRESRMRCHVRSNLKSAYLLLWVTDLRYWAFAEGFCLRFLLATKDGAEGPVVSAKDFSPWGRFLPKSYRRHSYPGFCKARLYPTLGR